MKAHLNILGTRGVPAQHGGFETFAERLAPFLVERGWTVNVYCQDDDGVRADGETDSWRGVERTFFRAGRPGPAGTVAFDLKCVRHVRSQPGIDLVLGYNTAVFTVLQRLARRRVLMNMDGIEWQRSKWGPVAKVWFFLNELAGANLAHVPIADHPQIAKHVDARCFKSSVMIPYGGDRIDEADPALLDGLEVTPGRYFVSIARIEPENSIQELVEAATALPDVECLVLGRFDPDNAYHAKVRDLAGPNVRFPGAIYDQNVVGAIRYHALAHLHGHQVGGTNPSLVEALGAGNAILAHDNRFNRWTAGAEQSYFSDSESCRNAMERLASSPDEVDRMRMAARKRHAEVFQWDDVLSDYADALAEQARRSQR